MDSVEDSYVIKLNDGKDSEYLFASCEIIWTIENFCFAYPHNKCSILSPEFMLQGLKSVYWRMSLELEDEESPEITDIEVSPQKRDSAMSLEISGNEMSPEKTDNEMSPEKTDSAMSLEMSPEKTDNVMSPEKAGIVMPPQNTDIKFSTKNGLVSVYLEILPTSQAKNVFVNWEMTLTAGSKAFGPYERKDDFVEQSKHGHIGVVTTHEILANLLPSKHDKLSIRFHFIAFDKDKFCMPKDEKPPCMFHLYKDFKHFKDMEENYSDIKLKVKDKYIKAHKIVLSCNERFDIYIKQAENDIVQISDFDYKTLDAFVNFLYSREVSYCLEDLSLSMIRCMDHFNCDALKTYYIPEEIPLNSKIQIINNEFRWHVPDTLEKNAFAITSPPIKFLDSSTIWHLTITMKANDRDKFISILAEITAGDKPKEFSVEFALINETEIEYFPCKIVRYKEWYENLGFDKFVTKTNIREGRFVSISDCVGFLFRIRTSNGSQESWIGCHAMSFILPSKSKFHKRTTEKMLDYCKKEIYSDITIYGKNDISKANKFILAARSLGFRELIENNENIISAYGIEPYLLRSCLKYMYTGVLDEKGEVILELKKISAPEKLHIPSLHAECVQYLKERNACYNVKRKY